MKGPRIEWVPKVGDRVMLASLDHKRLDCGEDRGPLGRWAHITIHNGAGGVIVGGHARAWVIVFDALGPSVAVSVPAEWLVRE